jgi:DNA-binding PadR family transcriptional regulator
VSGAEIMIGLRQSGFRIRRADLLLRKLQRKGNIIAIGRHRSRRYQFSKKGKEQAQQIARDLISQIPSENAESREAT